MDRIWKWSVNYPGSQPITPFKEYIRYNQIDTDHYYTAYPGAATNDVKHALRLHAELQRFAAASKGLDDATFARQYARFLTTVAGDLQTTGSVDHAE
jgi:hypothetical protein